MLSNRRRVCPCYVCPPQAGIDSKLMTVGSYGFHPETPVYLHQLSYPRSHGNPLARASNETWVGKKTAKKREIFDQ